MSSIRIILADDHALLRSGLVAMLAWEKDIDVVGEAANGREAVALYDATIPDVAVLDVTMPEMGGLEAAGVIIEHHPEAKILMMTQHEEASFIEAVLATEVSGCIGKRAAGTEFVSAVRAVYRGEFYLHPAMARLVVRGRNRRFIDPLDTLTPREREIMDAVLAGETNGAIARRLCLSVKTVEWHRANFMSKLDVHGVADLMHYAMEHGLVQPSRPIDRM